MNDNTNPVVGHKTMHDGSHKPLRKDEADDIWAAIEAEKAERERLMPELSDALRMLGRVSQRLNDLGWRDAIYCPKDGQSFEVIEFGSTGIHECTYEGKWPSGRWVLHEDGDMWPSRPVLFREIPAQGIEAGTAMTEGHGPKDESPVPKGCAQ